jgi:hypothetical protein
MLDTKTALDRKVEEEVWQIAQYERLFKFNIYEATEAVDLGVDYHDVDIFIKEHTACSPQMAVRILA